MAAISDINRYIDYIRDPKDDFEMYLAKARDMTFRCIFAYEETYDRAREVLAGTDVKI